MELIQTVSMLELISIQNCKFFVPKIIFDELMLSEIPIVQYTIYD